VFNRHLPNKLYENLPGIYMAAAVLLAFVMPWPWSLVPAGALIAACWLTVLERWRYRTAPKAPPVGGRLRVHGRMVPVPPRRSAIPSMPLQGPADQPASRQLLH